MTTNAALVFNDSLGTGDIVIANNTIAQGDWLHSAVFSSLFTDAYAGPEDLPGVVEDRRGHWADAFLEAGQSHGSLLWTLHPGKLTRDVVNRARDYALQALQWLIDDGLVRAVSVEAERYNNDTIAMAVTVTRLDGTELVDQWEF